MTSPETLHALTGNQWVPAWALRPGAYAALRPLAAAMPLFLLLHSRNADAWLPCYASREALGATIGVSSRTVTRQLKALRSASLVFEVARPPDRKTQRHRPPARWALDPIEAERWRPKVEESLARVAEQDGHDGRWFSRAVTALDAFDRRSRRLAARIAEDMPVEPSRKRRRRKNSKKKRAARQIGPSRRNGPRGDVSTTGEVEGGGSGEPHPRGGKKGKSRGAPPMKTNTSGGPSPNGRPHPRQRDDVDRTAPARDPRARMGRGSTDSPAPRTLSRGARAIAACGQREREQAA